MRTSRSMMTLLVACALCTTLTAQEVAPGETSTNQEQQKVSLSYQFKKGDVWRYQLREKGTQESISPVSETLGENDSSLWKHYRVLETFDDGSALLEVVVDRFQINFKMYVDDQLQQTIAYDTADKAEPSKQFRSVKNSIG